MLFLWKMSPFSRSKYVGSCETNSAYCSPRPHLAATWNVNSPLSQNATHRGFQIWKKENQYGSPAPHSPHWWTDSSGPDGLQLEAQQDVWAMLEKAVCHVHLSYSDCSLAAASSNNSLQWPHLHPSPQLLNYHENYVILGIFLPLMAPNNCPEWQHYYSFWCCAYLS